MFVGGLFEKDSDAMRDTDVTQDQRQNIVAMSHTYSSLAVQGYIVHD